MGKAKLFFEAINKLKLSYPACAALIFDSEALAFVINLKHGKCIVALTDSIK